MDKYDEAIEWLVERPDAIDPVWIQAGMVPHRIKASCLFAFCSPSGLAIGECGCLTMVRDGEHTCLGRDFQDDAILTEQIRDDVRLPRAIDHIEHLRGDELRTALQPFAFWQRRLDREIRQPSST